MLRSSLLRPLRAAAALSTHARSASVLVLAELSGGALSAGTLSAVTAAAQLGPVTVLAPAGAASTAAAGLEGVARVISAPADKALEYGIAGACAGA